MSSTTMTAHWRDLREAAVSATGRGWPVVPGTFLGSAATDVGTLLPALRQVRLHGTGSWIALPPTATEVVLAQRWWTAPPEGEPRLLLPTQVVLDALLSSGMG